MRYRSNPELYETLVNRIRGRVERDVDLAPLVRWRVGGRAFAVVTPSSPEDVAAVLDVMASRNEPLFIMGDASNLLFDSRGFDGVIMRVGREMSKVRVSGSRIYAEGGIWIPRLAHLAANAGLSGLEHTIGIPGTLGGLILMNGGSQRKGIGLNVARVDCVDETGQLYSLTRDECGFSYRRSSLQQRASVVVGAELELVPGDRKAILREMIDIMMSRKSRFPKSLPNGGSTFLSDPAMYAKVGPPGKIIEDLGFKGMRRGGAQISPQHANFIVNTGFATSDDVLFLIHLIRTQAFKETGYWMDCEVRFVDVDGTVSQAHEAAERRFGLERV